MATIAEIRQQYPQYNDLSDQQLADSFHDKFYKDIPKEDFYKQLGVKTEPAKPEHTAGDALYKGIRNSLTPGAQVLDMLPGEVGKKVRGVVDSATRGIANTASWGFADELAAGANTVEDWIRGNVKPRDLSSLVTGEDNTWSGTFKRNLQEEADKNKAGGAAYHAGQVVGLAAPTGGGLKLAGTALAKAPKIVQGIASGGLMGALYGFGDTEGGLADRAKGSAVGAAGGAAVGGAVPVVAPYVAKVVEPLVPYVTKAGNAVVDGLEAAGKAVRDRLATTAVEKLSPAAQKVVEAAAPGTVRIPNTSVKALEQLSKNPEAIGSDIRVRDMFLAEKARVAGRDLQREVPDDEVFKGVGDKLKGLALGTVTDLVKAGKLNAEQAKEVAGIISRAARHNRAITGEITDEVLAKELANGFRTDTGIIDGLNIGKDAKRVLNQAIRDLDTVTYNAMKKNQGAVFEVLGKALGAKMGSVGGLPGAMMGGSAGGTVGRVADKVLLQKGTAPVLRRATERVAEGLDEAGVKAGDTVGDLMGLRQGVQQSILQRAQSEKLASDLAAQQNKAKNIALARVRAAPAPGSPQDILAKAFEEATGIKHQKGMVEDVLKEVKKDPILGEVFAKDADQAISILGAKKGRVNDLTELVRAVKAKASALQKAGEIKIRKGYGPLEAAPKPEVPVNPVYNQTSYDEAVRTAGEAADLARKSAPSNALAQFATQVAGTKSIAEKEKMLADLVSKTTDPAEIEYLNTFVAPLTRYGKK